MIPGSTIDRQIDSVSRRVASIDPGPLALAVKSLMEDLTSRHPGITITDMVKADLTIAGVLGQHDGGEKRGRPRDREDVHPSVGTTWALVGALARLVVLSHVVELGRYGDLKTSMLLMRNPTPLGNASFQPTGMAADRQATLLLEDHGEVFPMSLKIPRDVDRALRSLGQDEMASGWEVSSMKDVMPKIMVELTGLENYDLGTVRAYAAFQHEFVLSEIGLSMAYGNGDHIAPEILSRRKGMVDRVFASLLYGCDHATAVLDGGDADPADLTEAGLDAEGQDQRSKEVDWRRVSVPLEVAGAPMAVKRFLMMSVLGSCRLRGGGEVYDAMPLGRRFQDVLPLSPVAPLDGEDRERLVGALESFVYKISLYDWSKGLYREIAAMRRMTGVVTKESEHRSRDIGHLFTTGEDAFATKRTKPLWAFMGDHGWDDDDLDRFRMPFGQATIDFRELDVDGETPLSGSVVSLLPCDVRRRYDESRLRGIEAKTRLLGGFLLMDGWGVKMVDALDTISWFPEEVRRPAVDGLLGNLDVVVQGRSFLIGDCRYCLTEAMMDQDPSRGYDELDGEERFVVMQKAYHAHQIVRRLKDQTETAGADPLGSLGLADIIVMLSLLCSLHDDGLMDAIRLDSTRECYDVLGRECFRLCVGPEGCDDRSGSFRSMYRRLSSGEGFDELDTTFDRLEDVLVDSVIHRLAIEFGTADDGDLPADYLVEDMIMGLQDRYSDVVESSLGGRGNDAGRGLDR